MRACGAAPETLSGPFHRPTFGFDKQTNVQNLAGAQLAMTFRVLAMRRFGVSLEETIGVPIEPIERSSHHTRVVHSSEVRRGGRPGRLGRGKPWILRAKGSERWILVVKSSAVKPWCCKPGRFPAGP